MTKKQAIEILKNQLEKVDTQYKQNIGEGLLIQTRSYILDFFGRESMEYAYIVRFNFLVADDGTLTPEQINDILYEKPIRFKRYLSNCIETLNNKGLYVPPKNNFITRMSEGWAIFWFSTILLVWSAFCYGIGVYLTQNKIDREKIDLKIKNDSLFRVTQSFIINANKPTNDNTTKGIYSKPNKQK